MSMSERSAYLTDNPHIRQEISSAFIGDTVHQGQLKPSDAFRDVLREIKRAHGTRLSPSTINTF